MLHCRSLDLNRFPGVQAVLDKTMATNDIFKNILKQLASANHMDVSVLEKRFRTIYDTTSKEQHGDIGDRIVIQAVFEFMAIPFDIVDDAILLL